MEKLWYQISRIGLMNGEKDRRDLILLNKMAFILMALTIFITLVEIYALYFFDNPLGYGSQRIIITWLIAFICILLNRMRFFTASKLILALIPVLILTFYPFWFQDYRSEYILYNPITVIAFSVIPHLLFTAAKEKPYYYGSLIYLLVLVLISDIAYLKAGSTNLRIYHIITDDLLFQKIAHLISFAFINFGIIYFKRITQKSEADLEAKNIELKDHKEELLAQNEELISYQEELQAKHEALTESMQKLEDAQSQLIMSEKMASLGQLMAGIAHEINNPVNYIQAGVTGLKEILKDFEQLIDVINNDSHDFPGETCKKITAITESLDLASAKEDMHTIADSILEGIHRTTQIIGGLKQFSYRNEEKLVFYNIHESIDTSLILLHNKYKDRIDIKKNYGKTPMIECFPGYLNQAMLNILDNAIDAISGKGEISISTNAQDNGILIEIHDNGPGIPEEVQSKIFDPFFTTKEIGKGTGLGLSITYDIIKKHNGKIWVKSEAGNGTSFFIFLNSPQIDF